MSSATNKVKLISDNIANTIKKAIDRVATQAMGDFAVGLIVARTRQGYGVGKNDGPKGKFFVLSKNYIEARKKFTGLDGTTTARRSNLTRTGQMLRSMQAKYKSHGVVWIEPTGTRTDSRLTNLEVAEYAHDGSSNRPPRPFNRLSAQEFAQVLRFYRKTFGDLIKKSSKGNLIR